MNNSSIERHHLGSPPVEHRFLGLDRRLIMPTLAVLFLVIFWSVIIPAIDEQVDADEIPAGTEVTVGAGVSATFVPAGGWIYETLPFPSNPAITIFKDGVSMSVNVGRFDGTSEELLQVIADQRDGFELTGDRQAITLSQGIAGVAQEINRYDEDAAIFAFATGDKAAVPTGVQIEIEGPAGSIDSLSNDIASMIASLTIELEGGSQ